jgi:hypothetical protein
MRRSSLLTIGGFLCLTLVIQASAAVQFQSLKSFGYPSQLGEQPASSSDQMEPFTEQPPGILASVLARFLNSTPMEAAFLCYTISHRQMLTAKTRGIPSSWLPTASSTEPLDLAERTTSARFFALVQMGITLISTALADLRVMAKLLNAH